MNFEKKIAEENFEYFLMAMDDQIDWLIEESKKYLIDLENSLDVPDTLENLFDKMSDQLNEDEILSLTIIFGRYLGEFLRSNHGGQWVLPLDDQRNVNFNTPVITGHSPIAGLEFAPIRVIRAYALRKGKGTIRQAIENHTAPQVLDVDLRPLPQLSHHPDLD